MIDSNGIRRDGFQTETEIWENGAYLGQARALEFEEVTLEAGKATVGVPEKRRRFSIALPRLGTLPAGATRIFAEVGVPAGWEFCIWQINASQSTSVRRLEIIVEERGVTTLFSEAFEAMVYLREGEPLIRESRDVDWVARFSFRNLSTADAWWVAGYSLVTIEKKK